jgi:aldehyde dehydrogenase (NAD+)
VVFEDAAIDQAIEGIVNGIYFNQGHVCCAGSRLLVQESIADLVIRKLRRRIQLLRVGDPLDKNTDVGAINSLPQLRKIERLVELGVQQGAEVYQSDCTLPSRGYWYRPTVLTRVSTANIVAREEIFGPVLSVLTFRTPDEAVQMANNTRYGLSAGVWTNKGSKYLEFAARVQAGVVWCNTYNKFDPASPFGGYKESGFGREGGVHGLAAYVAF